MTTKKWIRAGMLSCAFLISSLFSSAQFKVIGYLPSWAGDVGAVQYSKLTHINYAFLLPNTDGSLQAIDNASKLSSLVSTAHANGVKVLISVGGWNDGNDNGFETLAGNTTYRANFVNNISNFASQYNLDGVDIDWEYPDAGTSANNYVALMTQLATKMHGQGKLLTAAVVGTGGESVLSAVFAQVDFLNLMAYDYNNYDHSTYSYASQSITYWKGRGLPANKTVLGVPFYGRPSWESYAALIARGASPYADTYSGVGYNGITTIKSKTDLAYDQAGGIMMWELSQDAVGQYSLLSAIHDEVVVKGGTTTNPGNKPPVVNITAPAGGASFAAPASVTITASASDADGNVTKVEFYNGSTKLGESTSSPYTYSWSNVAAGSYSLIAKATDNGGAVTTSATIAIVVTGTGGGNCNGIAAWQAASVYTGGMQAVYNSKLYTANWWTQNEQPDTHAGDGQVWKYVADCGGGTTTPGNVSPVVNISSPAGGASFTAPASVTITASASDADGSVSKVDFYNGSTKLGTATASPYSYTWGSVAAGSYSLTAIATDNAGATTTSGAVSISVTGSTGNTGNCAGVPTYAVYPAIYNVGDKVVYNGYLYQSLANSLYNVTPGTADWWWQPLGACGSSARVATTIDPATATAVQTLVAYPNPVTGSTLQLQVGAAAAEKVYIEIWSVNGTSPVLHKEYIAGAKGQQLISIDISRVPQGTFIIKTSNAAGTRKGSAKIVRM